MFLHKVKKSKFILKVKTRIDITIKTAFKFLRFSALNFKIVFRSRII